MIGEVSMRAKNFRFQYLNEYSKEKNVFSLE